MTVDRNSPYPVESNLPQGEPWETHSLQSSDGLHGMFHVDPC